MYTTQIIFTFIFLVISDAHCGHWLTWSTWGDCVGECGKQIRTRQREFNATVSTNNTITSRSNTSRCSGMQDQRRRCMTQACIKDKQMENLIRSIVYASIIFIPAIIVFIVVGICNYQHEKRDHDLRQKYNAKEEKRLFSELFKFKDKQSSRRENGDPQELEDLRPQSMKFTSSIRNV